MCRANCESDVGRQGCLIDIRGMQISCELFCGRFRVGAIQERRREERIGDERRGEDRRVEERSERTQKPSA